MDKSKQTIPIAAPTN